jgi:hypothetical protein
LGSGCRDMTGIKGHLSYCIHIKIKERVLSPDTLKSKAAILQRLLKRGIKDSDDSRADRKKYLFREPFIYTVLRFSNEKIQLFILELSTEKIAKIKCEIIHEALKNAGVISYNALLYIWGAPKNKAKRPISV